MPTIRPCVRFVPMSTRPMLTATGIVLAALLQVAVAAAQNIDVSVTPFMSFPRASDNLPRTGLALTLAGSPGFALRASGRMALHPSADSVSSPTPPVRPWGADVDAVFALGGRPFGGARRTASTVAFVGLGRGTMADSSGVTLVANNWSYGLATVLPLGSGADLIAETRWRLGRLVLPTANPHPTRTKELRFGLSLHMADSRPRR